MALAAGTRLGPYEILAPIGAGGMGEVYKARDTRLDRIVAVKVSKTEFSERFEREARAIATLNHPYICQLYDVGPNYLVMEFVEGAPLKGPLPLDQTLKYAAQICDALDAAHKKNITHRDLKPANILVTKAGVKLLDFGLAKVGTPLAAGEGTMTMALTGKGEILGTFQYMSPEQINGQEAGPAERHLFLRPGAVRNFDRQARVRRLNSGQRDCGDSGTAGTIGCRCGSGGAGSNIETVSGKRPREPLAIGTRFESRAGVGRERARILKDRSVTVAARLVTVRLDRGNCLGLALIVVGALFGAPRGTPKSRECSKCRCCRRKRWRYRATSQRFHRMGGGSLLRLHLITTSVCGCAIWHRSKRMRYREPKEPVSRFGLPTASSSDSSPTGSSRRPRLRAGQVLNLCDAPVGHGGTWNQNDVIIFAPGLRQARFSASQRLAGRLCRLPVSMRRNRVIAFRGSCPTAATFSTPLMRATWQPAPWFTSRIWPPRIGTP